MIRGMSGNVDGVWVIVPEPELKNQYCVSTGVAPSSGVCLPRDNYTHSGD